MGEIMSGLATGFSVALDPFNLMLVLIGCFLGTLIGALPGLGPINGVAILLPIAYGLQFPPESALILLAGIYHGAAYGGRISSILLYVPGDAAAVMPTLDSSMQPTMQAMPAASAMRKMRRPARMPSRASRSRRRWTGGRKRWLAGGACATWLPASSACRWPISSTWARKKRGWKRHWASWPRNWATRTRTNSKMPW